MKAGGLAELPGENDDAQGGVCDRSHDIAPARVSCGAAARIFSGLEPGPIRTGERGPCFSGRQSRSFLRPRQHRSIVLRGVFHAPSFRAFSFRPEMPLTAAACPTAEIRLAVLHRDPATAHIGRTCPARHAPIVPVANAIARSTAPRATSRFAIGANVLPLERHGLSGGASLPPRRVGKFHALAEVKQPVSAAHVTAEIRLVEHGADAGEFDNFTGASRSQRPGAEFKVLVHKVSMPPVVHAARGISLLPPTVPRYRLGSQ